MNARPSTTRHHWLLGLLAANLLLHFLVSAGTFFPDFNDWSTARELLIIASISTVFVAAGWVAIGPKPLPIRVVESLTVLAVVLIGPHLPFKTTAIIARQLAYFHAALFCGSVLLLSLTLAGFGWRVVALHAEGGFTSHEDHRRFSLRALFRLVVLAAIAAGMARELSRFDLLDPSLETDRLILFVSGIVVTFALLPLVPLMLGTRRRKRWLGLTLWGFLAIDGLYWMLTRNQSRTASTLLFATSIGGFVACLAAWLWMLRRAGYRLITRRDLRELAAQAQNAAPAPLDDSPPGLVQRAQLTP